MLHSLLIILITKWLLVDKGGCHLMCSTDEHSFLHDTHSDMRGEQKLEPNKAHSEGAKTEGGWEGHQRQHAGPSDVPYDLCMILKVI